jgi:hypothetical protein
MTSIGYLVPALALLILTMIGCDPTLAIILLCISVMINGTVLSGYMVNQLELTTNYAGTVFGVINTTGNMCGFATPAVVGALIKGQVLWWQFWHSAKLSFLTMLHIFQQSIAAWNKVFYLASGIYVFGTVVFVLFARTSIQPWNTYWEMNKDPIKEDQEDEQSPLLEHWTLILILINVSNKDAIFWHQPSVILIFWSISIDILTLKKWSMILILDQDNFFEKIEDDLNLI